jgi:hypothetical protein
MAGICVLSTYNFYLFVATNVIFPQFNLRFWNISTKDNITLMYISSEKLCLDLK